MNSVVSRRSMIVAAALSSLLAAPAVAQEPKANGETLRIQNYAGTTGNMHAIVARAKGFCDKYNFKCEISTINSTSLGLQALIGKTIDVTQGGADLVAASVAAGGDVTVVGTSLPAPVLSVSVRKDVPLPNRDKGYPAIMKDFKGLKVGVAARGTSSEIVMNSMLAEGGVKPDEVTYVAIGGPTTGYAALAVGKQIDAIVMYQPLTQLCEFNKTCETVVDMTIGQGGQAQRDSIGANVIFSMRREMVNSNPNLVAAFYAAMKDAAAWFNDPMNFDELVKIYTPIVSFGDMPGADQLRINWIKSVIPAYSKDLVVKKSALQEVLNFSYDNKIINAKVDAGKVLWEKAPQVP